MHRSRLAGFIIDCNTQDIAGAARFWSEALGCPLKELTQEADPDKYRQLLTEGDEVHIEVQQVNHGSRVHLDIETDDVAAEVRRLEALGAKAIAHVHTWCVMQAPTGQRFCVVRVQRRDFAEKANRWA